MKKALCFMLLISLFSIISCKGDKDKNAAAKDAAKAAAESWLTIMDTNDYEQGYEACSDYLKNASTKDNFLQSLNGIHKPLGKLEKRELKSMQYMTKLAGAPDGEYVLIQFKSSYENKKETIEAVTMKKEKDAWKTAGYFIK